MDTKRMMDLDRQYPVLWIEEVFGEKLWDKEREIVNSVRDNIRTTVKSCHGSGKSFDSARIALWFLYCFPNSKVITTAPTFRQVQDILWREIRTAHAKSRIPLSGKPLQTSLELGEEWFALGLSTDDPDRFQGYHADYILLICDEAAGIKEDIYEASTGIVSSQHAKELYIGNPTNISGTFYNSFKMPGYNKIHISAFDTPNFTKFGITLEDIKNDTWKYKIISELPAPYLITPEWVADKFIRWGEGTPMWDSRVIGTFPVQGDDTLIPLTKVEEAVNREIEVLDTDHEMIGVDIARFGGDRTVFCYRKGNKVLEIKEFSHKDTMETAQNLFAFAELYPNASINLDVIGVGGGVVDRIRQLLPKREIIACNVGEQPLDKELFLNKRAEMYWNLKNMFIKGEIQIPNDEDLIAQLSSQKFKFTQRGQIQIESKDEMKKRGMGSPDKADALMLAFNTGGISLIFTTLEKPLANIDSKPTYTQMTEEERKTEELKADLEIMRNQKPSW
jgi:hypothetical protein